MADKKTESGAELVTGPMAAAAGGTADRTKKTGRGQVKDFNRQTLHLLIYTAVCLVLLVLIARFLSHLALWINLAAYAVVIALDLGAVVSSLLGKKAFFRLCVTALASISLMLGIYVVMDLSGVFDKFTDLEALKAFIVSTGPWGKIILALVQFAQVLFLPIPSIIISLAGVALYGATAGFLLSLAGMLTGSIVAFSVGKI